MAISTDDLPIAFTNEIVNAAGDVTLIRSNIKCMADIDIWVSEYGKISQTKWNSRTSKPVCEKQLCSKKFVCHHSGFMKVDRDTNKRGISKNSECPATIYLKIKLNTLATRKKDSFVKKGLCGIIIIKNIHNHSVCTGETLRFLPADPMTREAFIGYFNDGMGVAESCKYHEGVLELQKEYSSEEYFASGRINPTNRSVRYWHDQWRKSNLGPRNGLGLIEKLREKQKIYEEKGNTVLFSEVPFAVAVVTPLMKRAHQLQSSKEIVFVDSTSSCDAENHSVTFLLTPCAAGAVPLGIIITKGQTHDAYTAGFHLLQKGVPNSFAGQIYPAIFLTDQSQAEISALRSVWPRSRNLLCIFHVCQAVWRWLWDSKHSIRKEDRQKLMNDFQRILYASTVPQAESAYADVLQSGSNYAHWQNYISDYWTTKEKWCLAWRDASSRGHHTNNFSEVSIRLFKDTVLSRVKAYNVIALVDFSCTILENYYCHRLRSFANCRTANARLFLRSMMKQTSYLKDTDINKISEDEFLVPSEKDKTNLYCVNIRGGCCSCVSGQYGRFCKHQCAVYRVYDITMQNFPPVTAYDRHSVAQLALGEKTPSISFYQPFLLQERNRECISQFPNGEQGQNSMVQHVPEINPEEIENMQENAGIESILALLKKCDQNFGSSSTGVKKIKERLEKIKTAGQWETFLHTAGNTVAMRQKDGAVIRVQPTSIARRSLNVTRGSKRLPSGRPANSEVLKKKRKRNLASNIEANQPNAKSHGFGH